MTPARVEPRPPGLVISVQANITSKETHLTAKLKIKTL